MAVFMVRFAKAKDNRVWRYGQVTPSQKRKLFELFGPKIRVTNHKNVGLADMFVVKGTKVFITPRGRVMDDMGDY